MSEFVLSQVVNRTGVIQLNRPKALNALDLDMIDAFYDALMQFEADDAIDCIVVESLDTRAFCAGGDMRGMRDLAEAQNFTAIEHFFRHEYRLNLAIAELQTPYVCLIDGYCMGGGCGLSVHGRYRVATEKAGFAMPECKLGFFPDVGGSYFLARFDDGIGQYVALTGDIIRGSDGVEAGFATHYVKQERLPALRDALLDLQGQAVEAVLSQYLAAAEPGVFSQHKAQITEVFAADDFATALNRLAAQHNDWAESVKQKLRLGGPYSMQLTWIMLERGATLDLKTCLEAELAATRIICTHPDYFEGIRSVLIDKDQSPHWQSRLPVLL